MQVERDRRDPQVEYDPSCLLGFLSDDIVLQEVKLKMGIHTGPVAGSSMLTSSDVLRWLNM